MPYLLPEPLKPGGTVGVIAPSSPAPRKTTAAGLQYFNDRGYKVKTAPNLNRGKFFLAGSDAERLKYLEQFLRDPEIDALFCVRGGYGLIRIIDQLKYQRLAKVKPKVLVGYSDITILQMALAAKLGWVTYSGPMVSSDLGQGLSPFSEEWLWRMIAGNPYPVELINPLEQPLQVFRAGSAEGVLIGGCLSLITPLLGTPFMPDLKGAILIIEDVDEKTYQLDKQLQILRLHGVFDQIAGLIVGQFVNCFPSNPRRSFTLEDYLSDALKDTHFPVITNCAYGHLKQRFTIPMGIRARISTNPPRLTLLGL
ncbi:MAG TPA: LD-carboxypeptidase [Candidatus Marinimicrobia bacterium]|nr:LD-carboxypeptidase [Candidatus Neomarinimicrobiota bacterium]HRS51138.1 LD-carboxypeptidase [Candidatus Neomarinimicrobiota bacterium]HRU92783.1 LD-carboxypeptidase [Candidatus Neomarinimicrobiota bacterium]